MWKLTTLYLVYVFVAVHGSPKIHLNATKDIVADPYTVLKLMASHKIVSDLVSFPPKEFLRVHFKSGVSALLGNELTPTQVKDVPKIQWNHSPTAYYTLLFLDPDFPTVRVAVDKDFRQWMVINIPGNNVTEGEEIVEYVGALPAPGSGYHRFVFLVYQQPRIIDSGLMTFIKNTTIAQRIDFGTKRFVKKNKFDDPVAGNFFYAKYDDYVPVIHKQFGVTGYLYN